MVWTSAILVVLPVLPVLVEPACTGLYFLDLELDDLLEVVGVDTVLAALGVAIVVQYHLPLASAQAWPSLAVP